MPRQVYIPTSQPINNTSQALFSYCVEKAIEKELLNSSYTHNQWANLLFTYEKKSSDRNYNMSIVKREFGTYFTHTTKYAFEVDKLKRDFPNLFGIEEEDALNGEKCHTFLYRGVSLCPFLSSWRVSAVKFNTTFDL